jgi:hypothetical protein
MNLFFGSLLIILQICFRVFIDFMSKPMDILKFQISEKLQNTSSMQK